MCGLEGVDEVIGGGGVNCDYGRTLVSLKVQFNM